MGIKKVINIFIILFFIFALLSIFCFYYFYNTESWIAIWTNGNEYIAKRWTIIPFLSFVSFYICFFIVFYLFLLKREKAKWWLYENKI